MTGVELGAEPASAHCRACRTRDCCRTPVRLTGDDVMRIARALGVPPEDFARLVPAARAPGDAAACDDIRLGPGGGYALVLAQRETEPGRGDRVCQFLLELRSGRRLCGLAELAPSACGLFPRDAGGGLHAGPGCWRAWTAEEAPRRPQAEGAARAAQARWAACIAAWNAIVATREGAVHATTFLDHLFTAYA